MDSKFKIDSLKITFNVDNAKAIAETSMIGIREITGEVEDRYHKPRVVIGGKKGSGLSGRFQYGKVIGGRLVLTLYPQSILNKSLDRTNVKELYKYLAENGLNLSFNEFMNGTVTDCDIKRDIEVLDAKDYILGLVEENKFASRKGELKYSGNMLAFGKRTGSTYKEPYFKIYNKDAQLLKHYGIEKPEYKLTDTVRAELTIKDKQHFKIMGIESNTLQSVLETPANLYKKEFDKVIKRVFFIDLSSTKMDKTTSLEMVGLIYYIEAMVNNGLLPQQIVKDFRDRQKSDGVPRSVIERRIYDLKYMIQQIVKPSLKVCSKILD